MCWDMFCVPKKDNDMGFKKLHQFNLALLEKQGQKLLTNEKSVATRLLKARYYPHGFFLDIHLGLNPSFCRRLILTCQSLLKQGYLRKAICRVDAILFPNRGKASFRVFILSSYGNFLATKNGSVNGLNDPHLAEALGVKEALTQLKDSGWQRDTIELNYSMCIISRMFHPKTFLMPDVLLRLS